jgi:hypothetical protein
MAILKKRTSSKQLPEARGLDRAPLGSIIRGVDNAPALTDKGTSSITSAGGAGGSNAVTSTSSASRPFTPSFTNPATSKPTLTTKPSTTTKPSLTTKTALTTKPTLTSKTTPTTKTTTPTTKPTVTTKTPTTPATKTTTPTSVVKPTVKPNVANPNSTTNKVVNALTGAAIGAGTKLLIDKITGKPATSTSKPNVSTNKGTPANSTAAKTAAAATAAKAKAAAANKPTSVVKPPVTTPPTGGSASDAYKGTPADPSLGLPEGAIDNGDGTYTVGGTTYSMENDAVLYTTDADGKITVAGEVPIGDSLSEGETIVTDSTTGGTGGTRGLGGNTTGSTDETDTTVADNTDVEYFQDDYGNVYTMNEDGSYELYSDAGGSTGSDYADNTYVDPDTGQTWTMAEDGSWSSDEDTSYADNTYTDPDTGAVWNLADNGEWTTDWTDDTDYSNVDYSIYADNDYNVNNDDSSYYTGYDDEEYAKRGGLITMMNKGGVAKFEDGGYVDNGDGTYSIGNFTYDMETDEYLYSTDSDSGNITNVSPDAVYSTTAADDYYDTDSLGNIFKNGELYRAAEVPEDITSAGGGERPWYSDLGNVLTKGATSAAGLGRGALDSITGALGTTAGAAGAGALVATLLGQDFGGGTGNQNQGLDMSQVGLINPRTTDFGIGPTRFVGYEDYGTSGDEYTPNEELLRNLNAPGYNPVNEGDYGYEEVAADEAEATPKMASGGLSSMATPVASYYTFGQPADILANLGMRPQPPVNPPEMMPQIGQQRPPDQAQQQGLPQQQPPQMTQQMPQGMPQQGMMPQQQGMAPPMRKGGLPHASDVPMVEGRMDFRRGSAVHGAGDGQSDDIPAMLADGEYVIDAETVAQIGNGSTKAGAQALDKFREGIRAHKRSAPVNKIPPKTKALTSYLKGAK